MGLHLLKTFFKTKERIVGITILVLVLGVYIVTNAKTILPFGSAGELTIAGMNVGLAHPPGYVIYTLILGLFIHIIPFGSIAFRANLVGSIIGACIILAVYHISLILLENPILRGFEERVKKKKYKTIFYFSLERHAAIGRIIIAANIALFAAFSNLIWFYSGIPDQYIFADLLILTLIYLSLALSKYLYSSRFKPIEIRESEVEYPGYTKEGVFKKYLFTIVVISALLITFVPDVLFVIPIILLYVFLVLLKAGCLRRFLSKKNISMGIGIFILAVLLPVGIVYLFHLYPKDFSWSLGNSLTDFWGYISGGAYSFSEGFNVSNLAFVNSGEVLGSFWQTVISSIGIITVFLSAIGLLFLLLRNRLVCLYWILLLTGSLLAVCFYAAPNSSSDSFTYINSLGLIQAHYILPELIILLLVPVGIYALYKFFGLVFSGHAFDLVTFRGDMMKVPPLMRLAFLILFLCFALGLFISEFILNLSSANHDDATYVEQYAKETLQSVDKNAVILCFSNITCYSYIYEQQANHVRDDITIVPGQYELRKAYLDDKPNLQHFYYEDNPYNLADIVSWNLHMGTSVYLSDNPRDFISFMGLDGQDFFLTSNQYLEKIQRNIPSSYPTYPYKSAIAYVHYAQHNGGNNAWREILSDFFTENMISNAYLYWEVGDLSKAEHDANLALSLDKKNATYMQIASSLTSYTGQSPYQYGRQAYSTDLLYNLAVQNENKPQNAYLYAQRVTFLDPLNIPGRLLLAQLYQAGGDFSLAKIEYNNVLKIDPNNAQAKQGLKEIS